MPRVTVKFLGTLRRTTSQKKIDSIDIDIREGETLRDLLVRVSKIFTDLPQISSDRDDDFTKAGVWIFVNGRNVVHLNDKFNTKLQNGDIISIVPAVAGG